MPSPEKEIVLFAVWLVSGVAIGVLWGRDQDVDREADRALTRWRAEQDGSPSMREERQFLEDWRSVAPWGRTLRGGLIGAAVAIGVYAVTLWNA